MMLKNKKKLKLYEVGLNSETFAIGLVEDPAISVNFIHMSEQKPIRVCLEDNDRHLVYGPVLTPDVPIYRRTDEEEFYITFPKNVVEKMAHQYMEEGRLWSFTENHDSIADDTVVVESWVKMGKNDKSVELGIDVPDGTWMMGVHITNDELWNKVKNGELKGFSIECAAFLDEIKINKDTEMNKDNEVKLEAVEINDGFWDKLRKIISDALGKPQESEEVEKTVGEIVDEIEVDGGSKDEKPKVIEQSEPMQEEVVTPQSPVQEIVNDVVNDVVEQAYTPEQAAEDLQSVIDSLRAEVESLKAENDELKKQNQKLAKQPSTKPIKTEMKKTQNPMEVIDALRNGTYFK